MTLLEKAQAIEVKRKTRAPLGQLKEELQLVFAYTEGRLTGSQVMAAVGQGKNSVNGWCGSVLLRGIKAGLVKQVEEGNDAN